MGKYLLVIGAVCFCCSVFAGIVTNPVDGVVWEYRGPYTVLTNRFYFSMNQDEIEARPVLDPATRGIVEMPRSIEGDVVRELGQFAFYDCTNITCLVIPDTVTNINPLAFVHGPYRGDFWDWWRDFEFTGGSTSNLYFKGKKPMYYSHDAAKQGWGGTGACGYVRYVKNPVSGDYYIRANNRKGLVGTTIWVNPKEPTWKDVNEFAGVKTWHDAVVKDGPGELHLTQDDAANVLLTADNTNSVIYYTTDGSLPTNQVTESCHLYSDPIPVPVAMTVQAIACIEGCPYYPLISEYVLPSVKVDRPECSSSQGYEFHLADNVVSISSATEGAEIRYTVDGTVPNGRSRLYSGPFAISESCLIRVIALRAGLRDSEVADFTFVRVPVAEPEFSVCDATFENLPVTVSLSCETESSTIFYTVDGRDPLRFGLVYEQPIDLYKTTELRAVAVRVGWLPSPIVVNTMMRKDDLGEAANWYRSAVETDEAAPWQVDDTVSSDGVSSIRSGVIGNNGLSGCQLSIRGAGRISFRWRAMCEAPDGEELCDYGVFILDGEEAAYLAGHDTGWVSVSRNIATSGKHTFRWEYRKDGSVSYQPDALWVDVVEWVPASGPANTVSTPVPVPFEWIDRYELAGVKGYEDAANAPTGKPNDGKVWEDYVAGTDPTNLTSSLVVSIEMDGVTPRLSWTPALNGIDENGLPVREGERIYRVYGSERLTDGFDYANPVPEGEESNHRFFKVGVSLP